MNPEEIMRRLREAFNADNNEEDTPVVIVSVSEMDVAKKTVGVLTAARAVHVAHDEGEDCDESHEILSAALRECVRDPITATMTLNTLAMMASQGMDSEDIEQMAMQVAVADAFPDEEEGE